MISQSIKRLAAGLAVGCPSPCCEASPSPRRPYWF